MNDLRVLNLGNNSDVREIPIDANKINDINYMMERVWENYRNYKYAHPELKENYNFVIEAINSCVSFVNSMEDKRKAFTTLNKFLGYVKITSKRVMVPTMDLNGGVFGFKEVPRNKKLSSISQSISINKDFILYSLLEQPKIKMKRKKERRYDRAA